MQDIKPPSISKLSKKSRTTSSQNLDWVSLIEQWKSSALSQNKFCESLGISRQLFSAHYNRLNKNEKPLAKFIPVKLTQEILPSPSAASNFVLLWPNGIKLSIPVNADKDTLKIIISCMEN